MKSKEEEKTSQVKIASKSGCLKPTGSTKNIQNISTAKEVECNQNGLLDISKIERQISIASSANGINNIFGCDKKQGNSNNNQRVNLLDFDCIEGRDWYNDEIKINITNYDDTPKA